MEQAKQRFVILSKAKDLGTECRVKEIPRFSLALPLRYLSAARNDSDIVIPTEVEGSRDIYPLPPQTPRFCLDLLRSELQSAGFTLVELAIALMVIGLLIGGILKGQELIENARVTRMVKDINDYDTAVLIFRNTYNALPGDIKNPARRLPNCATAPCNSNANTGTRTYLTQLKRANFWRHLDRAGLITGIDEDGDYRHISPPTAFGGWIALNTLSTELHAEGASAENPVLNQYILRDDSAGNTGMMRSCQRMAVLDAKLDDGKPLSGKMQLYHENNYCEDSENPGEYIMDTTLDDHALVRIEFAN